MLKLNSMIETLDGISKKALNSPLFLFFFTLVTILGFYVSQFLSLDLFLANVGSSASHWLHFANDSTKGIIDWPTGTRNLDKSLPMHTYSLLFNHTKIPLNSIIKIYILIEIFAVCSTFFYLHYSLAKKRNIILAIIFALIVALTSYQAMNIARFGIPFYWGLYYGLASAFRILGLIFIIKKRPWSAIITMSLAIMIHPIMGGIAIFAGGCLVLFQGIKSLRSYLAPTITLFIPVLCWFYFMYSGAGVSGNSIPSENFLFFTKLFNSHWYPTLSSAFDSRQTTHLLPTISIMMLYIIISCTTYAKKNVMNEIHVLVLAFACLTIVGVLASLYDNIFLIKMSLHRASSIMVAIAFIPIIIKLWDDIFNANIFYRCLAIYLIFSPFLDYKFPGFSLLFTLIYAIRYLFIIKEEGDKKKIIYAFLSWIIGLSGLIYSNATLYEIIQSSYIDISIIFFLGILILISKYFLSNCLKNYKYFFQIICLIVMSIFIIKHNLERTLPLHSEKKAAYYDLQLWAKKNTKEDSLFMLDPTSSGAWRDVSERASFGNAKEWLHNGWIYNTNSSIYYEGIRRATIFNSDLSKIMEGKVIDIADKGRIGKKIISTMRKNYYTQSDNFLSKIAAQENINYFVFENKYLLKRPKGLEEIFKNKFYSIYKPIHVNF